MGHQHCRLLHKRKVESDTLNKVDITHGEYMSVSAVFQKEGGSKNGSCSDFAICAPLHLHGIPVHSVQRLHGEVRRVVPDENRTGGALEGVGTLQRSEHWHGEHHWREHTHDSSSRHTANSTHLRLLQCGHRPSAHKDPRNERMVMVVRHTRRPKRRHHCTNRSWRLLRRARTR